jgi:hypothetical protein
MAPFLIWGRRLNARHPGRKRILRTRRRAFLIHEVCQPTSRTTHHNSSAPRMRASRKTVQNRLRCRERLPLTQQRCARTPLRQVQGRVHKCASRRTSPSLRPFVLSVRVRTEVRHAAPHCHARAPVAPRGAMSLLLAVARDAEARLAVGGHPEAIRVRTRVGDVF